MRYLALVASSMSQEAVETVNLALLEVSRSLSITNDTFHGVCLEVEAATSKEADKKAFRRLNGITRMFWEQLLRPSMTV